MPQITVTAPNGVRAKVRVQEFEEHTNIIPAVRNSAGDLLAPERRETFKSWADKRVDQFASESRSYDMDATHRIVVEENP